MTIVSIMKSEWEKKTYKYNGNGAYSANLAQNVQVVQAILWRKEKKKKKERDQNKTMWPKVYNYFLPDTKLLLYGRGRAAPFVIMINMVGYCHYNGLDWGESSEWQLMRTSPIKTQNLGHETGVVIDNSILLSLYFRTFIIQYCDSLSLSLSSFFLISQLENKVTWQCG